MVASLKQKPFQISDKGDLFDFGLDRGFCRRRRRRRRRRHDVEHHVESRAAAFDRLNVLMPRVKSYQVSLLMKSQL